MNCIFICIFNQEKYVEMAYLLLESIFFYGCLDDNTNIIIYTSTEFMDMIKQNSIYNDNKIIFEINDTYNTIDKACKARLDLFNLSSICTSTYTKILCLDADIIVKGDINSIFSIIKDDILYTLEEGNIDDPLDYWGNTLFGNNTDNYSDKSAFTSGILLFNNCETIKNLFGAIIEDIQKMPNHLYDRPYQPYMVYNAFKYNCYNNKILKQYAVNNDHNINSDTAIHLFSRGQYCALNLQYMSAFLDNIKAKITPIFFQTNKSYPEQYIIDIIKDKLGNHWEYKFYDDSAVIDFFQNNKCSEFPLIIEKYNSIASGAHRADLFRYYYIYLKGGFFMDSDAMIYENISNIIKDYNFISVNSSYTANSIFQGILGASPKHHIIQKALYDAYNTDYTILLNDYHYWCNQLYNIIQNSDTHNIKLYSEVKGGEEYANIVDNDKIIFKHYYKYKIIPYHNKTEWNHYNIDELHQFDHTVLSIYEIPNKLIRIGPNCDGGYIIADSAVNYDLNYDLNYNLNYDLNYDLFISCGIANDIRFEEAFLDKYKNIKCIAFDGTIEHFPQCKCKIEWVNKNIGYITTSNTTNLKEYIKDYNNIFLKMDIEGSEFNWIDAMTKEELNKFSQIVMEIHWPFDIYRCNMLKKLANTHYAIHIHGNNYSSSINISNLKLPEVMEITYINKKLFANAITNPITKSYPILDLDYPNNTNINDLYFTIPINNNYIFVGSSDQNSKIINLSETNLILGHNLLNKQYPLWGDKFNFKIDSNQLTDINQLIVSNKLIVTRLDLDQGWGQDIIIPIKRKEILVYNGFPFHYEMFGFILDFCNKYNIDVTIINKINDNSWLDVYRAKYKFNSLETLPPYDELNYYLFVLLLTDDDISFPDSYITRNVVCIDHMNKNRRPLIEYHIPIAPFNDIDNTYAFPIFEYINYETKIESIKKNNRPIITFLGNSSIPHYLSDINAYISNISDFDIYIINRTINNTINLPNIYLFENISAMEMFKLLTSTNYICYIPNNTHNSINQMQNLAISACLPLSFSTGCKLIIPKEINKFLKLKSAIEYTANCIFHLDTNPELIEIFKERENLINIRDAAIFNLEHIAINNNVIK